MEEESFSEAPAADPQAKEPGKPSRLEVFLKNGLLFVFGVYSCFAAMFCLIALIALSQDVTAKSITSTGNTLLMTFFSIMAFVSIMREQSQAFIYSLLLFAIGFITTGIYRMAFITDELGRIDFNNFLIFSIPAMLTFLYSRLIKNRPK